MLPQNLSQTEPSFLVPLWLPRAPGCPAGWPATSAAVGVPDCVTSTPISRGLSRRGCWDSARLRGEVWMGLSGEPGAGVPVCTRRLGS